MTRRGSQPLTAASAHCPGHVPPEFEVAVVSPSRSMSERGAAAELSRRPGAPAPAAGGGAACGVLAPSLPRSRFSRQ